MGFMRKHESELCHQFDPCATDVMFNGWRPLVSPNDIVLVVGPGIDFNNGGKYLRLPMDRSVVTLPPYLAKGHGKLYVMDAPIEKSFGLHDLAAVEEWLKFEESIVPICPVETITAKLLDPAATIPEPVNVITDHLTSTGWILKQERDPIKKEALAREIIDKYSGFLTNHGKILFFYRQEQDDGYDNYDILLKILTERESGFKISEIPNILDEYKIPDKLGKVLFSSPFPKNLRTWRGRLHSEKEAEGILVVTRK